MGWNVTCSDCKAVEKYVHPACGCKPKREAAVRAKMMDHKVVEIFTHDAPYVSMVIMHLRKDTVDLYVGILTNESAVEASSADTCIELTADKFAEYKTTC